jgi:dihydroorotase
MIIVETNKSANFHFDFLSEYYTLRVIKIFRMQIILRSPSDFHTHLRGWNGDILDATSSRSTALLVAAAGLQSHFKQVLVMPNLLPTHIVNASQVDKYRDQLSKYLPEGIHPLMTISLKPETTVQTIQECRWKIAAVKYYPGGVTTNSGKATADINPDDEYTKRIFEAMVESNIVLSLHPETVVTKDSHGMITKGFVHRAEREFSQIVEKIAINHPNLQIVIEHISTEEMVGLIASGKYQNIWGSVTPQHLLCTAHDKEWGHAFETHLHCKPTLKNPEDLLAIQALVYSGNPKVFFGSDSAPHPQDLKECAHCASGVFSSPIALQIVTDWWMSEKTDTWWKSLSGQHLSFDEKVERLQHFFADNGEHLYWSPKDEKIITLESIPYIIPASYTTQLPDLTIVPMWAGKELSWSIVS